MGWPGSPLRMEPEESLIPRFEERQQEHKISCKKIHLLIIPFFSGNEDQFDLLTILAT